MSPIKINAALRKVLTSKSGATMVEYALIVGLIAAISVGLVKTLGTSVSQQFTAINNAI